MKDQERVAAREKAWFEFVASKGEMLDREYIALRREFEATYDKGYEAAECAERERIAAELDEIQKQSRAEAWDCVALTETLDEYIERIQADGGNEK